MVSFKYIIVIDPRQSPAGNHKYFFIISFLSLKFRVLLFFSQQSLLQFSILVLSGVRVYLQSCESMDKFDRNGGGDRYSNSSEDTQNYNSSGRHSRGGGAPFHHRHQEGFRRDSPIGHRSGFSSGGGRCKPFDSPPPYASPPSGGGGGGLRPFGDGIGGFQPMVGGGEEFGGFRLMGGGGFRPMGGDGGEIDGFPAMAGGGGNGGRFGLDSYHMSMPPPTLTGQKRGYPFSARERSPGRERVSFVKLFVGSVPRTATEDDVRPLFEKHGRVMEVALIRDRRTGQQQGCCFIKYASPEDADRAIGALHNQYTLPGGNGPIQVRYADGERERLGATEYKLFVGSLNKQATEKDVEEIFLPYGRVEDVYLMRDEMKQSRGCGFVKYSQREMAQAAINALNGIYTMRGCDQPLTVRFADPKRPRPGESRGGPSYGGPGFGPRFSGPGIRPPPDGRELFRGPAPNSWPPVSPQNLGPASHVGNHGFGNQFPPRSGDIAVSSATDLPGPTVSSAPMSQLSMRQGPSFGSKKPPVQIPLLSPQPLPHSGQLQPASFSNIHGSEGSHLQPSQMQAPRSASETSYGQAPSAHLLPGQNGQLSVPQNQVQHSAPSTHGQAAPEMANQRQPHPHPLQPSPSELAQMLSHQKQTLQATFQSSQQALNQLQQQVQQLQPSNQNLTTQQGQLAANQQSPLAGTSTQPIANTPGNNQPAGDLTSTTTTINCNWSEHTSPDGYKYYYNSLTGESKWEKPEELTLYEQQQQKQSNQHPQVQSHPSGPYLQQAHQMQVQLQGQHQAQIHNQAKPFQQAAQSSYQAPGFSAMQGSKELGYAQGPAGTGQVNDPARYQQAVQASQEWMWKNNHSGI